MYMGFRFATLAGVSIGIEDMVVPDDKEDIIGAQLKLKFVKLQTNMHQVW